MTSLRLSSGCLVLAALASVLRAADQPTAPPVPFPFQDGDRVAWIGSSSTRIGVWPQTMEFLLRTRHPQVKLSFQKFTTGGGTFGTGLQNLDKWLGDFKPTLVFFNYGGNDANGGAKGLPVFKQNMEKCLVRVKETGGRAVFITPQAADVRKSGEAPAARRTLYADAMIVHAKEKNWQVIDTHRPLEALQLGGQKDIDSYTILRDSIHLTDPAYIAWGYYLYERLHPPAAESSAFLTATGQVTAAVKCKLEDVKADKDGISFVRSDEVLPILPPVALPPRKHVPLESLSRYVLKVTDLPDGHYAIRCERKMIGSVAAKALAAGVNLNSVLLESGNTAPWDALAKELWAGKALEQIGKTRWRFEVRKQ